MNPDFLDKVVFEDDLGWEYLILDIVEKEGLDPWDIDVSKITKSYLSNIKKLEEVNFPYSGRIILIAAILLSFKSKQFIFVEKQEEDIVEGGLFDGININVADLEPNFPLPKTRKITLQELLGALNSAMVVEERKRERHAHITSLKQRQEFEIKLKDLNIAERISKLFSFIKAMFSKLSVKTLEFSKIVPSHSRSDIISTFIPLIHLSNHGDISLRQDECFGEIMVGLRE